MSWGNFNLIVNSRFNPFSYQDFLAPALMATQAHQELENQYGELATKASIWDKMANEQTDNYAYNLYKSYAKDLEAQANQLAEEGLNAASRKNMLNMKARYSKEILPIEQAYTRRQALADEQRKALASNPTMLYQRYARDMSLDDLIANPQMDYGEQYSGALLAQQAGTMASALAKELRDYGKGKALDGFTKTFIQKHGFTRDQILEAISEMNTGNVSEKSQPVLNAILDQVVGSSGIGDITDAQGNIVKRGWGDDYTVQRAYGYASDGLWNAIGQSQVGTYTDDAAKMAKEQEYAIERMEKQHEYATEEEEQKQQNRIELAGGKGDRGDSPRHFSILEGNGDLAAYKKLQGNLTTNTGSLSQKYFGKTYTNPIKIYEEAMAAANSAEKEVAVKYDKNIRSEKDKAAYEAGGVGYSSSRVRQSDMAKHAAIAKARTEAINKVASKYGASSILSSSEVDNLKKLGYNANSTFNDFRNDYTNRVDKQVKQYSYSSVNLSNLDVSSDWLSAELQSREDNGTLTGSLYEFSKNGTKGKAIKDLDDIDFSKDKLTDVYYSRQNPGHVVLQIGSKRYLADASLLSSEAKSLVDYSNALLNMSDTQIKQAVAGDSTYSKASAEGIREAIYESTTAQLRNLLRSYNKTRSNTDSDL